MAINADNIILFIVSDILCENNLYKAIGQFFDGINTKDGQAFAYPSGIIGFKYDYFTNTLVAVVVPPCCTVTMYMPRATLIVLSVPL